MTSVYRDLHSSMIAPITRTIGFKAKYKNQPFTIKNNYLYNSKPMIVILYVLVYHVIRCNLIFTIFYMHAFHKFTIFLILSLITNFYKIEFIIIIIKRSIFHVSCKYACFGTQNNHAMRKKNNNKYPCEF